MPVTFFPAEFMRWTAKMGATMAIDVIGYGD